ncbi:MAG TPA: L,D-transpeptidase family protein [Gammaproteobacteria bacterium]|nr:L,D-transpeptidase family protein [Gammaproteobacteria bacterium]
MCTTFHRLTKRLSLLTVLLFFPLANSYAKNFNLPSGNESLIGEIQYTKTNPGDTTTTISERYNVGLNTIVEANAGVGERSMFAGGTPLTIATQFMLPPGPRKGIVINLPEMRLYYYPEGSNQVMTFPVGIGRIGKTIPIRSTKIARKTVNPTWTPPEDIRKFDEEQGIQLPKVMGPGPDNPLGPYAIYLGIPTYLIHSTIFPESIGRRASFGCIRMNESDIKQFFPTVTPGTPVEIIDMPYKVAWDNHQLFLEAHSPLEERSDAEAANMAGIVKSIEKNMPKNQVTLVNWQLVAYLAEQPDGIPHDIGVKVSG